MAVLPSTRAGKIQWFKDRSGKWVLNAGALGLTPAALSAFETLLNDAVVAKADMDAARNASKAATQNFYGVAQDCITPGRELIATIKAYANTQPNPEVVLALAEIPPDAPPSPAVAPPPPTNLRGSISTDGILTLEWNSAEFGPSNGIVFLVNRKLPGQSEYTLAGATFDRAYIDTTFEAAAGATVYKVQAQRGGLKSAFSQTLSVDLGFGGAGFVTGNAEGGQSEAA